jgi:recombination protein RecR
VAQLLPKALEDAISAFGSLPGVGARTAERYAYYLLRHRDNRTLEQLAHSIATLKHMLMIL